jgi:hypothetical protein
MAGRIEAALRALFARIAEFAISLVIVVVCFLAFIAILSLSFPEGTTLAQIVGSGSFRTPASANKQVVIETDAESFVAVLWQVQRRVQQKPRDAIAWGSADTGMQLRDRHAVQSFSGSAATVSFDSKNRLKIGENTLVVIRRLERQPRRNERTATVVVLSGSLSGTLAPNDGENTNVEIVTEAAQIRLPAGAGEASFALQVHDDQSSTLSVRGGDAEITWKGRKYRVEPDSSIRIFTDQPPALPAALPARPLMTAPGDGTLYAYRTFPPRVRFAWEPVPDATDYRLELSRDPNFATTVATRQTEQPEFVHGNLPAGRLYWRVQARVGEARGPFAATRSVLLEQDSEPPALDVFFPTGKVAAGELRLQGSAEPGAELYVDAVRSEVRPDGTFEISTRLEPGVNVVVIEALDAAGNAAYVSRTIHAIASVASASQRKR